jgi:hypothetical protein
MTIERLSFKAMLFWKKNFEDELINAENADKVYFAASLPVQIIPYTGLWFQIMPFVQEHSYHTI